MLTQAQAEVAVSLLREALDWVGLVNLTTEQEEAAEAVQLRIEALLMECGAMPGRLETTEAHRYRLIVEARQRCHGAEAEKIAARLAMMRSLHHDAADHGEAAVVAVRRYNRAYAECEAAEADLQQAEIAYHRALSREEGIRRCSA